MCAATLGWIVKLRASSIRGGLFRDLFQRGFVGVGKHADVFSWAAAGRADSASAHFCAAFNDMPLRDRFGLDQDLNTSVKHDGNGLFIFDISGDKHYQFSLEMCSALKLWISIGQACWTWLGVCVDTENAIIERGL